MLPSSQLLHSYNASSTRCATILPFDVPPKRSHPFEFLCQRDAFLGVSMFNRIFLLLVLLTSTLLAILASNPEFHKLQYLDVITFLSWIKLYISFSKYVPQVKLNYQRKSTVGWSIENILLGESTSVCLGNKKELTRGKRI